VIALAALVSVLWLEYATDRPRTELARTAPVAVFIVLDTVRADHLSACGYERPTSPFLEEMFRTATFATCRAYAPAAWTLPSHASFFTGMPVEIHGANSAAAGEASGKLPWGAHFTPLSADFHTLAEELRASGHRTVLVSANPVLSDPSGLTQGFEHVVVARTFGQLYGAPLGDAVQRELKQVAPDEPLLLVINIADAHNPWLPVPAGLDWLTPQPGLGPKLNPKSPLIGYVRGNLSEAEVAQLRNRYTDVYDYAVLRADRTLADVMRAITEAGLLDGPHNLVLTSDHGELLAERESFGHGGHVWEPSVRVPFVLIASDTSPPNLDEPLASMEAYRVLLGRNTRADPPTAIGNPRYRLMRFFGPGSPQFTHTSVAMWSGMDKLLWQDGEVYRYDLEADPEEQAPIPASNDPRSARLRAIAEQRLRTAGQATVSDDLAEQLRALGYAD
jgi:hypothetical protein